MTWLAAPIWGGLAVLYLRGRRRAPRRAIRDAMVAAAFGGSVAAELLPVHPFPAHMAQHLTLLAITAPLLILSGALRSVLEGLPGPIRPTRPGRWSARLSRLSGTAAGAAIAVASFSVVLLTWHIPAVYDAALRSPALHAMEHTTMLTAAAMLWWVLAGHPARQHRAAAPVIALAAGMPQVALAALLVFSQSPWYAAHSGHVSARLLGQQIGGAMMWSVMAIATIVVVVTGLSSMLQRDEQRAHAVDSHRVREAGG